MQYWRLYCETCSPGGHSEEHAVLEVLVRNMQYWRLYCEEHAVLEVLVRNMQYWRS